MKIAYNSGTKMIEVVIVNGVTSMTESLEPNEAILVANMIIASANVLKQMSRPTGQLTREPSET